MHNPPYRVKNMMPGMIMLWYGSVATIPSGWALCDGQNNTPDLRIKFVAGAFSDAHPTYGPGSVGGALTHDHDFTGDGHSHDLSEGLILDSFDPLGQFDHHTDTSPATGTTDVRLHTPPYMALCYIMKLPIP